VDERIAEAYRLAFEPAGDAHLDALFLEDPTCHYYRLLYHLACDVNVELGTCTGRGTAHLAARGGTVIAVDPEGHGALRINALNRYPNVRFYKTRSDDPTLLASVADGSVGLCFVDSVHAVDYALREVGLWTPKMVPGGIFLFDDLDWDDGMRSLLDRLPFAVRGDLPGLHTMGFGYAVV